MGGSRCYRAGGLSFRLSSDLGPPIRRLSGILEPLCQPTFTFRNCQWFCTVPKTRVHFLLCRATADNYHPCTISGPIKPLTTCCFRARVSCQFTSHPMWLPYHPSSSVHTSAATSSHRTRAQPVTSC